MQTGFSVPKKKFRSSVHRHRIRRLMVEAWRLNKHGLYETIPPDKQIHLFFIFTDIKMPEYKLVKDALIKGIEKLVGVVKRSIFKLFSQEARLCCESTTPDWRKRQSSPPKNRRGGVTQHSFCRNTKRTKFEKTFLHIIHRHHPVLPGCYIPVLWGEVPVYAYLQRLRPGSHTEVWAIQGRMDGV